jgi:hypothetical protein
VLSKTPRYNQKANPEEAPALRFPEADVVEALIQADGLTEAEALDQAQQERGLERYYFEWLKRWKA